MRNVEAAILDLLIGKPVLLSWRQHEKLIFQPGLLATLIIVVVNLVGAEKFTRWIISGRQKYQETVLRHDYGLSGLKIKKIQQF